MPIKIRPATPADAPALAAIYAPYVKSTAITMECTPPDTAEFARRIRTTLVRYPYLVAATGPGTIVGYAYASAYSFRTAYDWAAEVSVYVDQTKLAHGTGHQLYTALEAELQRQHVVSLGACITAGNQRSIAFHERDGFRQTAVFPHFAYKLDQWWDVVWLTKVLTPGDAAPEPFIPYSELR
nr:GNAT family N-acetyltransferase [Schleiferilactobacillus shenzhenensis]